MHGQRNPVRGKDTLEIPVFTISMQICHAFYAE